MHHFNSKSGGERHATDRYETPSSVTEAMLRRFSWPSTIFEPACGTGRIARVLDEHGHQVIGSDILESGLDFLSDDYVEKMKITEDDRPPAFITNPPYKGGLAEAFVRRALELTDGPVAMLLKSTFLYGQKRAAGLYALTPPSHIVMIPVRIKFYYADGTRITGQAYDHQWMIWRGEPINDDQPMVDWPHPDEFYDAK